MTGPSRQPASEPATFAGASAAQAERIAALTPTQRVELLEELLRIALDSGALARALAEKQRVLDAVWSSTTGEP